MHWQKIQFDWTFFSGSTSRIGIGRVEKVFFVKLILQSINSLKLNNIYNVFVHFLRI